MLLSSYLFGIRFFTFLTVCALLGIVFLFDPSEIGNAGIVLFFLILAFALIGIFLLLLISIYRKMLGDDTAVVYLMSILRQSILLACFITGIFLFQYLHILVWWDSALLFVFILLIEFTFRYFSHSDNK